MPDRRWHDCFLLLRCLLEIVQHLVTEPDGVALTTLSQFDDSQCEDFSRPIRSKRRGEEASRCFQRLPSIIERLAHSVPGFWIKGPEFVDRRDTDHCDTSPGVLPGAL